MPRRNRPKRGRYSRLSADKLKDIYQCLSDDPEIRLFLKNQCLNFALLISQGRRSWWGDIIWSDAQPTNQEFLQSNFLFLANCFLRKTFFSMYFIPLYSLILFPNQFPPLQNRPPQDKQIPELMTVGVGFIAANLFCVYFPRSCNVKTCARYDLKKTPAFSWWLNFPLVLLLKVFISNYFATLCTFSSEFHQSETRGRRRKNYALLHSKIDDILRSDSGLTLKSVVSRLSRLHGVNVSTETVSRALKRMHWTYKKQHFCPKGRNDPATKALRRVYCRQGFFAIPLAAVPVLEL